MEGSYFSEGCRALREGMVALADAMTRKHFDADVELVARAIWANESPNVTPWDELLVEGDSKSRQPDVILARVRRQARAAIAAMWASNYG